MKNYNLFYSIFDPWGCIIIQMLSSSLLLLFLSFKTWSPVPLALCGAGAAPAPAGGGAPRVAPPPPRRGVSSLRPGVHRFPHVSDACLVASQSAAILQELSPITISQFVQKQKDLGDSVDFLHLTNEGFDSRPF